MLLGDKDGIIGLQLAAYVSAGPKGENIRGGIKLSHSLGYALGSPYNIRY